MSGRRGRSDGPGGGWPRPGLDPGDQERCLATIVEYTDRKPPRNGYPRHIISPSHAGPCCFSQMEWLDAPQRDVRWTYQYRRCPQCGFAVRVILHEIPNAVLVASLREELAPAFVRSVPA